MISQPRTGGLTLPDEPSVGTSEAVPFSARSLPAWALSSAPRCRHVQPHSHGGSGRGLSVLLAAISREPSCEGGPSLMLPSQFTPVRLAAGAPQTGGCWA